MFNERLIIELISACVKKKDVNHFSEIWNAKMYNRYFTKWDNDYWID